MAISWPTRITAARNAPSALRYVIAGIAVVIIVIMVTISTRREVAIASPPDEAPPQLEAPDAAEIPIEQTETKVDKLAK